MRKLFVVFFLLPTFFLVSCTQQKNAESRTPESQEISEADSIEQKEEYSRQTESEIDSLNQNIEQLNSRIDELQVKAQKAGSDAQIELNKLNESVEQLNEKKQIAEQKLAELKASSSEAWQTFQSGVNQAVGELDKSYNQAVADFKKSSEVQSEKESVN